MSAPPSLPVSSSPPRPSLLYVEDNDDLRTVLHPVLESFGYRVLSCGFPERALLLFRSALPRIDLLLTDIEMPGFSGLVLAAHLTHEQPGLPVVLVSGGFLSPDDQETIRRREWLFLPKPVHFNELRHGIEDRLATSTQPPASL